MRVGTTIENVYETYTAAEAEYAVGIPVAMQRDWRRRGYLPPIEEGRKARYEGSEVARMAILKAVSDAGAYLHSAVVAADIGAPVILDILYAATLERARYRGPGPIQGCWEKTPGGS